MFQRKTFSANDIQKFSVSNKDVVNDLLDIILSYTNHYQLDLVTIIPDHKSHTSELHAIYRHNDPLPDKLPELEEDNED